MLYRPPYMELVERGVSVTHVKRIPGRKTDMSDTEWFAEVAAHGNRWLGLS